LTYVLKLLRTNKKILLRLLFSYLKYKKILQHLQLFGHRCRIVVLACIRHSEPKELPFRDNQIFASYYGIILIFVNFSGIVAF
jgi:hypothetical protein